MTERLLPKRRRGGRRKGERPFLMLGMPALFNLFETRDIDAILVKLDELGARPEWVSGWGDQRSFVVYAHKLPDEWRQRACEAADGDDGWRGYFDHL